MKILIASDSFKESMSSMEIACQIEKGIYKVFPNADVIKLPVADGGEGTADALLTSVGGEKYAKTVTGPLGNKVEASYVILKNGIGVIEMAEAAGLNLVPHDKRNPTLTTTYGVGELILDLVEKGCKEIIVGLGGSSTNDGGIGAAQALGISFRNKEGNEIGFGGGAIETLHSIDMNSLDKRLMDTNIIIASDVTSPLYGEKGAAYVFSPQKGADAEMVKKLDENLRHLDYIVKKQLDIHIADNAGSGAAGGLGYGLMAFCKAVYKSGIETVLDIIDFDSHLSDCDLVITGEGNIDGQSIYGKVPVGIGKRAKKADIPVIAFVGGIGENADAVYDYGISSIISIANRPMTLEYSMLNGPDLLEDAVVRAMRIIKFAGDIEK